MARAERPPKALGKGPSSPLLATGGFRRSLACGCIPPVSAFPWSPVLGVSVSPSLLIGPSVTGAGSTARPRDLILTWSPLFFFVLCVIVTQLCLTPWPVVYQGPPSMEFSRQEYYSGLPFPSPGHLPDPGVEPRSPALQALYRLSHQGVPLLKRVPFTGPWSQDLGTSFGRTCSYLYPLMCCPRWQIPSQALPWRPFPTQQREGRHSDTRSLLLVHMERSRHRARLPSARPGTTRV